VDTLAYPSVDGTREIGALIRLRGKVDVVVQRAHKLIPRPSMLDTSADHQAGQPVGMQRQTAPRIARCFLLGSGTYHLLFLSTPHCMLPSIRRKTCASGTWAIGWCAPRSITWPRAGLGTFPPSTDCFACRKKGKMSVAFGLPTGGPSTQRRRSQRRRPPCPFDLLARLENPRDSTTKLHYLQFPDTTTPQQS